MSVFKKANLVSMSKATTENDRNISTKIVAATFENKIDPEEVCHERVWKQYGFFDVRKSDYSMEKVNFPENILFLLNKSYLTVKKNKKIYNCDFFIVGQKVEVSNLPEDMSTYVLKKNKVKMVRQKCSPQTGEFLRLYKTVRFMIVRGSLEETFMDVTKKSRRCSMLITEGEFKIWNSAILFLTVTAL